MPAMADPSPSLSAGQIETLQHLIRQFKSLGKRFGDSNIPALIEKYAQTAQSGAGDAVQKTASKADAGSNMNTDTGLGSLGMTSRAAPHQHSLYEPSAQHQQPQALLQPQPLPQPQVQATTGAGVGAAYPSAPTALSWQCYHSLLSIGLGRSLLEGTSSLMPSDMGCFSKGAHLPLVPTNPAVVAIMDEVFASAQAPPQDRLLVLQRALQSSVVSKLPPSTFPLVSANVHCAADDVLNHRTHLRVRKPFRRDSKNWEKDERRRRLEGEERRRRRLNDYHKALMDHREAFARFHKQKRSDLSKTVRSTKLWVESFEVKRDKEETRAEMRRLQALKENDMDAYTSLVQETKNGRLKFLLSETDNYIATINKLIQEQRVECAEGGEVEVATAKNYYSSTHRTSEAVAQPRMLKGGDLKEYQLSGLQWLVSLYNNNLNGILADEMGLGKTIQTIALLCYLMENKHNNGPFLIVVPLSTLSNWVNEFNKWAPEVVKVVYKGGPDERRRVYRDEVEGGRLNVLLTTYEYIMKDKSSLRKLSWQYIIVDEGHRMKNAQSKFAVTLGSSYTSKHRILLTGTPLQNNLPELWALLNFLLPSIFSSVDTFDQWFNKPFAAFRTQQAAADEGGELNVLSQEERMLIVHRLHEVLRPFMLRRVKDQVLDQLPDKVEKVLRCALSGWQRKMYHLITMKGLGPKGEKNADNVEFSGLNNTIMQLRKVCNHPYLFVREHMIDDDLVRASGKFELLDRMLPKLRLAGHRVLIFSQMVEVMNFLEQFFILRGFRFLRLDGNTSSDEREKRMYAFNDPDSPYFIFLLSTRAGGLGLNLATADTVIIFDSDWNPSMDAQAQDRAHRIGQKNEVRVFRLLTNSVIEERILARANDKRNLNGLVVEAGKFNSRGAGTPEENKEMMESLLREWSSGGAEAAADGVSGSTEDFDSYAGDADVPDDEQLNEMMASYEGELLLYQQVDAQRSAKRPNSGKPPLMGANEIPPWLLETNWPTKYKQVMVGMMTVSDPNDIRKRKKTAAVLGNANIWDDDSVAFSEDSSIPAPPESSFLRKRKEVIYDDGLTELQFQRMVEQEQDVKEKEQQQLRVKKLETPAVCMEMFKAVQEIQKLRTEDGNLLAGLFLEKPSKALYPDYYVLIETPISLKEISKRLKQGGYDYFEEVELDFALMSHNARTFNTAQSAVFHCAEAIRREFYGRASRSLLKHGLVYGALECVELPANSHHVVGERSSFQINLSAAPMTKQPKKRAKKDQLS